MRPFHFLLFVLVAVVFNSCMQEKTQLVTEKIQYDVNIKSPDPDYDWWIQNLPGPQRENLVDMIMDGALSGKFQAYDYFNNPMLRVQFQPKGHPISLLYTDLGFDDLNLTKGAMAFD